MKFDIETKGSFIEGQKIDYGIIEGNSTIVFIKAGQDGSHYGYKNKYLKMAQRLNKSYGCTVITASNPFIKQDPLEDAINVIEEYAKNKFKEYTIYYMGHSNGGLVGAWFGNKYPQIKRMLLVNTPLTYNWHKTKEGLKEYKGELVSMVYGEYDISASYSQLLKVIDNDRLKIEIIEKEDHHFSNNMEDFLSLPEKYLFNK